MSSDQVCRYFQEGRCRFGERCRFLHPTGGQGGGRGGQNNAPFSQDGRGYGYDHRGAGRDSNRFEHFNSGFRGGGGERGRGGFSGYSNYGDRGGGYGNRGTSGGGYGDRSYGNRGALSGGYGNRGGGYGNRGSAGGSYGNGGGGYENRGPSGGGYGNRGGGYGNRGPSGGGYDDRSGGYGNRGPSDGGYGSLNTSYGGSGGHHENRGPSETTSPEELAQVIKEDMEIWAASQMWPFSCYSCEREGKCVPRLADLSPEELRWRVYEARGDSAAQAAYHDELRRLHEVATSVRRELARISPTNAQSLVSKPEDGGTSFSPSSLFQAPQQLQPSIFGGHVSDDSSKRAPFAASSPFAPGSLFGGLSPTRTSKNTANGSLTQGLTPSTDQGTAPSSTQHQSTITVTSTATTTTATRKLTDEELKAFKAEHFSLGQIPETPPPPELI